MTVPPIFYYAIKDEGLGTRGGGEIIQVKLPIPGFGNPPSKENKVEQPLSVIRFKDFGGQCPAYI